MGETAWRALTAEERARGVTLGTTVGGSGLIARCVNDGHDYWVPLHHKPTLPPETWTGVCGSCQRRYRLRLEVGE